ncbi:MAG: alpha-L-fucosidase [Methanoregulaceae archaeon]|nr:alpha-L-fucosidase [Methanoregulaceae archaeon]
MLSMLLTTVIAQTAAPAPLMPIPSPRQLAWHRLETYAFVHFGPNTFSGKEWGEGREDPKSFAPTALDVEQWVKAFKAGGMKMVILTAKHHDGFCLWPSKYSTHTVAQTDHKRDILRELSNACRKHGLKLGVYLSPWDRNHPTYGTPEYNDVFVKMLEEVLTGYGTIDEVWFDGANGEGPNGKRQVYDWPRFIETVRKHQPGACIFSDAGPDVRWVGNEAGHSAPTCWAMVKKDRYVPGTPHYKELTEGAEDGELYIPAEADVSIRPGWFYHADQDSKVKSRDTLIDLYFRSVGQNANFLLNVPPDRRGILHENDVAALAEFGSFIKGLYARDFARGAKVSSSVSRGRGFEASRVVDGRDDTYWAAPDDTVSATLELEMRPQTFDVVMLQEVMALGQRIRRFSVEARIDGGWREIAKGTTVGWKRLLRLPAPVTASAVRVRVEDARACPTLHTVGLLKTP